MPNVSVIAPTAILAVTVPEKMLVKFNVNCAVMFPFIGVTFVTVASTPFSTKSAVVTEVGSKGSLKFTSYVCEPGPVNVPPTGGLVVVTCSCEVP